MKPAFLPWRRFLRGRVVGINLIDIALALGVRRKQIKVVKADFQFEWSGVLNDRLTNDCKPFSKPNWLMPKPLMIRMTFLESPNAYSHTH
jgi:hypothetical protein